MSETRIDEVISRSPNSEAVLWREGKYACVRISGRFENTMAEALRNKVLSKRDVSLAIDISMLTNIPMHFARELYFASRNRIQTDHRLILVNPPDYLRSLLKLIHEQGIPAVPDFKELPADPKEIEEKIREYTAAVSQIRSALQTNPLWQVVDRENCWVCPFCACNLDDVRIISRVNVPQSTVEKVYNHVMLRCPTYDPRRPSALRRSQMEEAVQRINAEKFAASRERAQELQSKVSKLEEKSKWADEMEKGIKGAMEQQRHLLPTHEPQIPGVEISLVYRPAEQVSGDFYDFVDLGEGRWAFIIGDVSGHGIEAGIVMGMTKKVLQIRVSEIADLRTAVLQANRDVYRDMGKNSFVTAYVAILDTKTKKLTCVRAGHDPILIVNPARGTDDVLAIEPPGTILGMSVAPAIEKAMKQQVVDLQSGDFIMMYTDGLEEAHDPNDQLFGRERVVEVLRREATRPVAYILGALSYEVDRFAAGEPQHDDVTMIGIRIS